MTQASDYLFLPPSAITVSDTEFNRLINAKSPLGWGISEIDARMVPLIPADLMALVYRPSVGKTHDMMMMARHHAQEMAARYPEKPPLILYATWETMVEEFIGAFAAIYTKQSLASIARGTADVVQLRAGLMQLMGTNFCVFGVSKTQALKGKRLPPPSLIDLIQAIHYLQDQGHTVASVMIDYLQRMPDEKHLMNADRMHAQVTQNLEGIKSHLCMLGIPVIVGVQARREVDGYKGIQLPEMNDGQWSSSIEQTSDKIFSASRPIRQLELGSEFVINGKIYSVTPTTKVIKMLKQRFSPAQSGDIWVLQFDEATLSMKIQPPDGDYTPDEEEDTIGLRDVI